MEPKDGITKSRNVKTDKEYSAWIRELKQRYKAATIKAAVKVNAEQLRFNWCLGRDLVLLRAEERWGKGVVEQTALDLQAELPNAPGFSARNLWFMKQWYLFYASDPLFTNSAVRLENSFSASKEKLNQPGSQLRAVEINQSRAEIGYPSFFDYVPWRHHVLIIQKCKTIKEALFYIKKTVQGNLSRSALDNCIRADLYHTSGTAATNFAFAMPESQGELAQELLKGNYDFGFVQLPEQYNETELEDALEKQMTRFLLELGQGWTFVGRQKELIVAGKSRRIDLLFYHIRLRRYVVLELKAKPFEPEFAGKLNFYVNAVNRYLREDGDNPTIGLLVCKDMDKTEVHLSFEGTTTPMGVATYSNVQIKEIEARLPTAEDLQRQFDIAEENYKNLQKKKTTD